MWVGFQSLLLKRGDSSLHKPLHRPRKLQMDPVISAMPWHLALPIKPLCPVWITTPSTTPTSAATTIQNLRMRISSVKSVGSEKSEWSVLLSFGHRWIKPDFVNLIYFHFLKTFASRHMREIQALQSRQKEEIESLFTRLGKVTFVPAATDYVCDWII